MGDIVIRLRGNVATGEREILVEYDSDDDMTPLEHEQRHREIVERLVSDGVITRDEAERVHSGPAPTPQRESPDAEGALG